MRYGFFAAAVAVLLWSGAAGAEIIGWTAADDGDGVLTCISGWTAGDNTLAVDGELHRVVGQGNAGHLVGSFTTDTELDPTVTMINGIVNDMDFTWTSFTVNVTMNKTFTISNALALSPGDWSVVTTQPTFNGSQYLGSMVFTAGTPVAVDDEFDFKYRMSFLGSISYTQEMIPAPEPATLGLVATGALGLAGFLRRRMK